MKWFRHHVGMCRDDKLVRVAVKADQPVERVVWVFAAMLESACEIEDGGRFDLDPGEVAYFLRCDKADIEMIIACLTSAERIKGSRVWNWDSRQYVSDSSASRVRKHRERKAKQECNGDETLHPVTVTPPETETEYTVPNGTDAEASPASPKERLWVEGKPMLVALGVPPKQSGSIIGRWLRDARDDAGKVLDAISRARDQCPHDPIPWITATLKQDAGNGKSDISTQFRNAFNRIDERIGSLG